MNAIIDAFTTKPELNATWAQGEYAEGTIEGLRLAGRLHKIGHAEHVINVAIEETPGTMTGMREGYYDATSSHSPWELADVSVKAMINYVCLNKPVPATILMPTYMIELADIDNPPRWGQTKIWGEMDRSNFDVWPILDVPSEFMEGMEDPFK